ncbi:hypothetical protein ACOB87_37910 [Streptomyces sp. YS-B37]|uniref:hypothetical protein n=1 Tax=Streptomyces sp. YS-B37 TaxID=3407669 RepID=UPI003B50333C
MGFSVIPDPAISGFTGPTGAAGAKGDPGVIQSINGKSAASVTLAASDVNALPSNANATLAATYLSIDKSAGNYRVFRWLTDAVSRWEAQVDDVAEAGSASGSDFRLSARNDDGTFNKTVIHARRSDGTITFGTTVHHGTAQVTSAGALGLRDLAADPATATGGVFLYSKAGLPYIKQADGTVFQVGAGGGTAPVSSVNSKTGAVVLAASDVSAVPASSVGAASGVAQLDSTTRLPIAQIPAVVAKNEWTPQALGFQAWSLDPATLATPTVGRAITIGRTYLAGFNITEPTTVSKLFVFAAGWAGSTVVPAARFFAGIYKEDGTSLISSGATALSNIGAAGQTTGSPTVQQNSHAGAVPFPFTGSVTLQPGRYWGAFMMSAGATTDFYYFYAQNEAATNTSIFHNLSSAFVRNAYVSGMANLTTALTKANFQLNHDQMVMALA